MEMCNSTRLVSKVSKNQVFTVFMVDSKGLKPRRTTKILGVKKATLKNWSSILENRLSATLLETG
jgi:hypothetical protein